jgi:predicted PurR-regulated permease PerM
MQTTEQPTSMLRGVNWIFVLILTVILLLAAWQVRTILMLTFAAMLLTVFASIPVRFFNKRLGFNRGVSILLFVFSSMIVVVALSLVVVPTILQQFAVLTSDVIPNGIERVVDWWNSGEAMEQIPQLETIVQSIDFTVDSDFLNNVLEQGSNALGQVGGSVLPLLGGVASGILSLLIIVFLCLYFVAEPDRYIQGIIALTPIWYRSRMREILEELDDTIRAWLRVTGASMAIVGLGTGIGLAAIGIEQWAALGTLAGIMSFIPNFGPIIAVVPSVAVAIIQAPENTLLVIVVIYGVSFLQSQIVGPLLANESMNLAPVLILIGQIVFGIFFGFLGIMLAVPLTAIVVVLIREVYVKDILGDTGRTKNRYASEDAGYMELEPSLD